MIRPAATHFARVLPPLPGEPQVGRIVAACATIDGLRTTDDRQSVTCRRCLRLRLPVTVPAWREDATDDTRGDYERDRAVDRELFR